MDDRIARFAGVMFGPDTAIDDVLNDVIRQLCARGVNLAGVHQVASGDGETGREVVLRDLAGQWEVSILQPLGAGSVGCRLDPGALVQVGENLSKQVLSGVDLVVLNRFGKAEAEGRGLRCIIERCVLDSLPMIVPVRKDYQDAWSAFHGGMAIDLPAHAQTIVRWCSSILDPAVSPNRVTQARQPSVR